MAGIYTPYPDEDGLIALFDRWAPPIYLYALLPSVLDKAFKAELC